MKEHQGVFKELASSAADLTNAGLMRGWSGQLSSRVVQDGKYSVAVKCSGGGPDNPKAYCLVNSEGERPQPAGACPSLVTRVHCAIYEACPHVNAVVQCRGLHADAVAAVLGHIPLSLETYWALKAEPVVVELDTLRESDLEAFIAHMAEAVSAAMGKRSNATTAVCIPLYGMWVSGASVDEAAGRSLALEDLAKSAYLRISIAKATSTETPALPSWFQQMLQGLPRPGPSEDAASGTH